MERLSDKAIEIINELHTERLDYNSEYLPLIDAVQLLGAYEDTGLAPEEILTGKELAEIAIGLQQLNRIRCVFSDERIKELMRAEKEGRIAIHPPARKCPQCHRNQLVARTDGKFYYCFGCKTQFAESKIQEARP